MRRAYLETRMEVQAKNPLQNSEFAKKLFNLPMVKAAFGTAGDAYTKVKDSNTLVCKSIGYAVDLSSAVVSKLAPYAEKGINVAAPITTKMDALAAKSLEGLINYVPVIKEEPKEVQSTIMQNTMHVMEKPMTLMNAALTTWPIQSAMDVYESILATAYKNVLPHPEDEKEDATCKEDSRESVGEDDKHKRGYILAQKTYIILSTTFRRLFGMAQTQVENAANATDLVYKQVRNAVSDSPPSAQSSTDQSNAPTNGESTKPPQQQKKGKKKNAQD